MLLLFLLLVHFGLGDAAQKLGQYNADPSQTSVSGLSSGAFFATQLHVAYSATFMGAGIVAGGPYDCAAQQSYTGCMYSSTPNIAKSIANTKSWSGGKIDNIAHMKKQKLYLISGTSDSTVGPSVMNQLYKYYVTDGKFVADSNVAFKKDLKASHTFPTDFDSAGNNQCSMSSSPYISNCQFDGAGAILKHIYGQLKALNTATLEGKFVQIDQGEFMASARTHGMDDNAWLFVPKQCEQGQVCKLHVAFHGCLQGHEKIGDKFIKNTGYTKWADTNNILVLFPQAVSTMGMGGTGLPNMNGCWDFIGWYGSDFDVKSGKQMSAIKKMIDRITAGFSPSPPLDAPTGLEVTTVTEDSVTLKWNSVKNSHGYHVYVDGQRVGEKPVTETQHRVGSLASGTEYSFTVRAVSQSGAESSPSNQVKAKTKGEPPAIPVPTGLKASDVTANSITLKWNQANGIHNYNVYRDGKKVDQAKATTYTDHGLKADTQYKYQVSSVGEGGLESKRSGELIVKTTNQKVCYTDNNYNHVVKGRAHVTGGYAVANGSNQNMGLYNVFITTTLCMITEGYYEIQ